MTHATRLARARVLETLERRVKQFRWRDEIKPFRVPHEPLLLDDIIEEALAEEDGFVDEDGLRARTLLRMEWDDGHAWSAWAIALPSGITVYCDSDEEETRVLASVKRGSQVEADRFFLELLAESSGHYFGIEMAGSAPDRVRTAITDREFLADVFVEMFEDTPAQRSIHSLVGRSPDFRTEIALWLDEVLVTPTPSKARRARRRIKRLRDDE
jgi:hypothetical protein